MSEPIVAQEDKIEKASFIATFPTSSSAISMHGGGGMKIVLEIPESDVPHALSLTLWRDRALRVVISPLKKDAKSGWKE